MDLMEELPDTCLPYNIADGKKMRDLVGKMIKAYWRSLNEWTAASNTGLHQLKNAVGILVNSKTDEDLPVKIHSVCLEIDSSLEIMKKAVTTMFDLEEQLKKVIELQELNRPGCTFEPLFSTVTPNRFYDIFVKTANHYAKETEIKIHSCKPLPYTRDEETLNANVTLWTNSIHLLQPHLFHIKILLHEAQLL